METTDKTSPSLDELLAAAAAGDAEAVEALMADHRPELVRFVARQLGGDLRRRVDASDVVQEALAEVIRKLPAYLNAPSMPFELWLKETARERLIMERRRHTADKRAIVRETHGLADASSGIPERSAARAASPSNLCRMQERATILDELIKQLPDDDEKIVRLRLFDGLPYIDVARILKIECDTARQRYGRALIQLARLLKARGLAREDL
jgi:RNA polymerase sigma-70 factor (ECF subfamily)